MGDVAVERSETAPEAATETAAVRAPGGGIELSPTGVLALQRAVGNRAVRRILARTVSDDVFAVSQELNQKKPPDKATVDKAVGVAKQAFAEVQRLQAAKAGDDKIEEAYKDVQRVVSSLVAQGAENAAIDFAKTADTAVQTGALNALRSYSGSGVTGQQKFAVSAGRLVGVTVGAATAGQTSAAWLEAQTEKIGETYKKLESAGLKGLANDPTNSLSLTFVAEMLKEYFTISPTDVKPDPLGKVGKLKVGTGSQLEVDCDVYASYGARLLRAAGWSTVGYMAIVPGEDTGRDAHAVALAKRASSSGGAADYVAVSDFMLKQFPAKDDDAARDPLLQHGLDIYSDPKPSSWKSYYSAAGAGGAYDTKLLDPEKNSLPVYKSK